MDLYWGVGNAEGIYEIEQLVNWKKTAPNFNCSLVIDQGNLPILPEGISVFSGRLGDVISNKSKDFKETDAYVAGPPVMMPDIMQTLMNKGVNSDNITVDSFGL